MQEMSMKQGQQAESIVTCFMTVSCCSYYSVLKMEATCLSETSTDFQRTTQLYMPEYANTTLSNHGCENVESYIIVN
jgi:hypothetical protein